MRGGQPGPSDGLNDEDILTETGWTDGPTPNGSEVSEVVFSDAENLPLVASLCRRQRCKSRHARPDRASPSVILSLLLKRQCHSERAKRVEESLICAFTQIHIYALTH